MEGFSTPWSNKRTAGPLAYKAAALFCWALHPSSSTRPQSYAGPTRGRIPTSWAAPDPHTTRTHTPKLSQTPALRQTHTPWDTHLKAVLCHSPVPDPQQLGSLPLGHAGPQLQAETTPCQETCHSSPLPLRPCWAPAMRGMTGTLPLRIPNPQALPSSSSIWNNWWPSLLG
jgi:hypothetical protein